MNNETYSGLDADYYDELLEGEMDDLSFWTERVKEAAGRSLEVGCGTGRILIPLLKEGLQVDGMDISERMVSLLREKTTEQDFDTDVRVQAMESLAMGKAYSFIFIPGFSLQMANGRKGLLETLRRCWEHLLPGGRLAVSIFFPWEEMEDDHAEEWQLRKKVTRPDGSHLDCHQSVTMNLEEQSLLLKSRYRLIDGSRQLQKEEICDIHMLWFYPHEFHLLLEETGFEVIDTFSEYTDEPLDECTLHAVILAQKAAD